MTTDTPIQVIVKDSQEHVLKTRDTDGMAKGVGHFNLTLDLTPAEAIYLPLSIASGKKAGGFVYQIEGTGESSLVSAEVHIVDAEESGVVEVLLGTIAYAEIPAGKTATIRLAVVMNGRMGEEYAVALNRIQYKLHPADGRYKTYTAPELRTNALRFR